MADALNKLAGYGRPVSTSANPSPLDIHATQFSRDSFSASKISGDCENDASGVVSHHFQRLSRNRTSPARRHMRPESLPDQVAAIE